MNFTFHTNISTFNDVPAITYVLNPFVLGKRDSSDACGWNDVDCKQNFREKAGVGVNKVNWVW